jgi:hypothetical protein
MAYQGVLAYYYDQIHPGHAVELDVCRWNQVVADVIWRGPERIEYNGTCRQYNPDLVNAIRDNTPEQGQCQDCRSLPISEINTVHYTACKKPWDCVLPTPRKTRNKADEYRLRELTNSTTCGLLFQKYFEIRKELEDLLQEKGGLPTNKTYAGKFHPEYFLGYCKRPGGYNAMEGIPEDFDMKQIYGF